MANEYALRVTARTVWQCGKKECPRSTLVLDSQSKVCELIARMKDEATSGQWPKDLFLLARYNKSRRDGSVLDDKALPQNTKLATCNVQNDDHLDDNANPELVAALSCAYEELKYAHKRMMHHDGGRRCFRCGTSTRWDEKPGIRKWSYCTDTVNCGYPTGACAREALLLPIILLRDAEKRSVCAQSPTRLLRMSMRLPSRLPTCASSSPIRSTSRPT